MKRQRLATGLNPRIIGLERSVIRDRFYTPFISSMCAERLKLGCLFMRSPFQLTVLLCCVPWGAGTVAAQMPFYTDNADVTDAGTLHFEFFNEFDGLQSAEYPDLRQNTFNYKINYGLPHGLELDLDAPYLSILRAPGSQSSNGPGDTDMGIKWNFHKSDRSLSVPALSASMYIEFPTGDTSQQLGSGLTDYWLNSIAQEPLTEKTEAQRQFWISVRRQYQHRRSGYAEHPWPRLHRRTLAGTRLQPAPQPGNGGVRRDSGQ